MSLVRQRGDSRPPTSKVARPRLPRWTIIAGGCAFLVAVAIAHGYGAFNQPRPDAVTQDAVADWLVTRAAVGGVDPYTPVDRLGALYGVEFNPAGVTSMGHDRLIHPRLPGAIVLQLPLLAVTANHVPLAAGLWSLVMVGVVLWQIGELVGIRPRGVLVALLPLAVLHPFGKYAVAMGSEISTVTALIIGGWLAARRGRLSLSGAAIGLAAVLRVFPLLFLVTAWRRGNRRVATVGAAVFVLLNGVGSLWFGLSPAHVARSLSSSGDIWLTLPGNGSLAGLLAHVLPGPNLISGLVLVLAIGALGLWAGPARGLDEAWAVTAALAPLASPLSWPSYDLLLLAPLALLLSERLRRPASVLLVLGALVVTGLAYPFWPDASGAIQAGVNGLVIGALVLWGRAMEDPVVGGASCSTA